MNHLSLKLSRHLSSIAPGFEGHWDWCGRYDSEDKLIGEPFVQCEEFTSIDGPREWDTPVTRIICPAWQVEDVLRNWTEITVKVPTLIMSWHEKISWLLVSYPDTAYQKIEEYLWTILK
jgi:hypothetical protein